MMGPTLKWVTPGAEGDSRNLEAVDGKIQVEMDGMLTRNGEAKIQ